MEDIRHAERCQKTLYALHGTAQGLTDDCTCTETERMIEEIKREATGCYRIMGGDIEKAETRTYGFAMIYDLCNKILENK